MSSASETLQKLQALRNHGSRFGIDRMKELDAAIGAPSRKFTAIHVAGTNGKGSTSAMIEAIQRAHGRTTGLYTSPHLIWLGERVQINRRPLTEKQLLGFCDELFPVAELLGEKDAELYPSFFEFMTAMAFLTFARQRVDVGIVEVGLGGRLDATNILTPAACVITSIGLDHTDMLGDTIEKIAAEKAGILKPGIPLALGLVPPEAERVIRARAAEVGAPLFSVREIFDWEGFAEDTTVAKKNILTAAGAERADKTPDDAKERGPATAAAAALSAVRNLRPVPLTNLTGDHQRANAALALLACELASARPTALPIDEATARRALLHIEWSARWQSFSLTGNRRLILDVAHNEEGARALDKNLAALVRESGKKPVVVAGVLGIDRAKPLFEVFARHAARLILVRPEQERACSLEDLEKCVPEDFPGAVSRGGLDEIFPRKGVCSLGDPGDTIVVAGSVYLAGEVLSRFAEEKTCDEYAKLQDRLPGAEEKRKV